MTFAYLDESGDSGFKFRKGSSRYFVVTLLLVDDQLPLHSEINQLRCRLGYAADFESKFSRCSNEVRTKVRRAISQHSHQIVALVIDKQRIGDPNLMKQERFYDYVVQTVLNDNREEIQGAKIILDKIVKNKRQQLISGSRLRKALIQQPGGRGPSKITYRASHTDNFIQTVDMICGAIHRRYENNDPTYFNLISKHVVRIREWPD